MSLPVEFSTSGTRLFINNSNITKLRVSSCRIVPTCSPVRHSYSSCPKRTFKDALKSSLGTSLYRENFPEMKTEMMHHKNRRVQCSTTPCTTYLILKLRKWYRWCPSQNVRHHFLLFWTGRKGGWQPSFFPHSRVGLGAIVTSSSSPPVIHARPCQRFS